MVNVLEVPLIGDFFLFKYSSNFVPMINLDDTIIAPATGNQASAIAVLRISGNKAISITQNYFDKNIIDAKTHSLHFGKIKTKENEVIDEVLLSVFKNPTSYTGEDTVEISCHGSTYIQQRIIQLYNQSGVRMANPGEFTMRAFKNGKLDLTQAEAVADLIASDSKASHEVAMNQMRGGISNKLNDLREKLINFAALIELELDFSTEDVEFANRDEFKSLLNEINLNLSELIDSFLYGNAIKEGVSTAILGKPNAGKSSLLNAVLKEDKAIVSDIAGTTRDIIEDTAVFDGIKFRFIDTAGIRETTDTIESIGVERAVSNALKSNILIYLYEREQITEDEIKSFLNQFYNKGKYLFLIENKTDISGGFRSEFISKELIEELKNSFSSFYFSGISAQNKEDIDKLLIQLTKLVKSWQKEDVAVITQARHLNALNQTQRAINQTLNGLSIGIPNDLLAQDIREAIYHLGSITGNIEVDRDILGTIFGKFCIGK